MPGGHTVFGLISVRETAPVDYTSNNDFSPRRPTTFVKPDLASGTLSLPEAWDLNAQRAPAHPFFVYAAPEGGLKTITWSHAIGAFHRCARLVQKHVASAARPVVAVLSSADPITYFALTGGIIRADCIPFLISTRNSPQAVVSLLKKMDCRHLFVSADPATVALGDATLKLLEEERYSVDRYATPTYEELYASPSDWKHLPPMTPPKMESMALILHSSGSTAFPKPIILNHRTLVEWALDPTYGELDLCGQVFSSHALPPFHGFGNMSFCWAVATGLVIATWAPQPQPIVRTSENVLEAAVSTGSNIVVTTPHFIEQWSQDEAVLGHLQNLKHIVFGGAPLTKSIGDMLSSKGVSLCSIYGATETGIMSLALPEKIEEWEYFRLSRHVTPAFQATNSGEGENEYEAIYLNTNMHTLSVLNAEVNGKRGYNTGDLVVQHPTKPGYWKISGRADEQIMLATGEKTNPGPIEGILMRSPLVACAVMFGRGRFQSGVLIEPVPEKRFDTRDTAALGKFIQDVWPAVEEANAFAPQHSRIFKEMIIVASADKPFEYTAKGNVRRRIVIAAYDAEINEAYEAMENAPPSEDVAMLQWDKTSTAALVRDIVARVIKTPLGDDDDFFQFGCDSLQATYIRNSLLRAFRQSSPKAAASLPSNFVYQNPSINALSAYLAAAASAGSASDTQSTTDAMLDMLASLTQSFPVHRPSLPTPAAETILLTGSTGGLGTYILGALLQVPSVKRVFLLNRPGSGSSHDRQLKMLKDRGVDPAYADDERVTFLEANTALPGLGLQKDVYEDLRTSVTTIIHNAWKVDFNLSLASFKPNVVTVRNLVDLALASPFEHPPTLVFTSSIGVTTNWQSTHSLPEAPIFDPAIAVTMGYTEAKWVCERILHVAAEQTPLRAVNVRVGQMAGGSGNGAWTTQEWFPSLVKSSIEMGCIPRGTGAISWIPADIAARALVDFRRSDAPYVHLVHPNPALWNDVVAPLAAAFHLALVPYSEWLAKLERLATQNAGAPTAAVKIVDFFRPLNTEPASGSAREALGYPILMTKEAVRVSPTMAALQSHRMGEADAKKWLGYWESKGFIKA